MFFIDWLIYKLLCFIWPEEPAIKGDEEGFAIIDNMDPYDDMEQDLNPEESNESELS